jgi:molybdate transport system substrate-binding protein
LRALLRGLLVGLALAAAVGKAAAADIKVVTVGALRAALQRLAADYGKETGNRVDFTFTKPADLDKVLAGGKFDAIIVARSSVEALDKAGTLRPGTHVKVARTGIGVVVRAGAPQPDISTPAAFASAVRRARALVYNDPAIVNGSGVVTERIFTKAGLLDALKRKGSQADLPVAKSIVANGQAEMGFFNFSEASGPGVAVVGKIPPALQEYTYYDAAVTATATGESAKAASEFVAFISSRRSAASWSAGGLDSLAAPPS